MNRYTHLADFDQLAGMLAVASRDLCPVIRRASVALLEVDAEAGRTVRAEVAVARDLHDRIDGSVPAVLARRQPVASDLRLIVAGLRMNGDMRRMGALAGHIAGVALARYPEPALPAQVRPTFVAMADAAARLADKAALVLATRDRVDAMQAGLDDDVLDALQRSLFTKLTDDWPYGIPAAVDVAMLGRYYERFADHAVGVARQVAYLVLGSR
ncbi:phosphate transport system regulatory protein PhoU [Micromonospora fluostatini]|uniref:Phosphate transport system regulatory protein PhoU n=1 Tax=Micromonospora fluostatini TaxID=1629071 RepID=A0ABY2DMP8_9ACTN|nr:phosphate transport system regulatory protein PhoU [Micromonospora fluostatini]